MKLENIQTFMNDVSCLAGNMHEEEEGGDRKKCYQQESYHCDSVNGETPKA